MDFKAKGGVPRDLIDVTCGTMDPEQIVAISTRTDSREVSRPVSRQIVLIYLSSDPERYSSEGREGIEDGLECGSFACIHCGLTRPSEANYDGCDEDEVEGDCKAIARAVRGREEHGASNEGEAQGRELHATNTKVTKRKRKTIQPRRQSQCFG